MSVEDTGRDPGERGPDGRGPDAWGDLAPYLENLSRPVHFVIWADLGASGVEDEAVNLVEGLAERFAGLSAERRERRPNYDFYPVIGVMGWEDGAAVDHGLRLIGLPAGVQLTTLLGAIQAVAFAGQHVEPRARIQLSRMPRAADVEVITGAQDEEGASLATAAFGLTVCSPLLRTFVIMADQFPVVLQKYNVTALPHTVINGRVHIEGPADDRALMKHLALALRE